MQAEELLVSPVAHIAPSKALEGLRGDQAAARVDGAPHSIAEILAHIVFWQEWLLDRCRGVATPMPAAARLGWPAASAEDWEELRRRFAANTKAAAVLTANPDDRTQPISPAIEYPPLSHYTVGDAVTHIAMHVSHHVGQIVTMRQLLGAWPPPRGSYTW